MQTQLEFAIHPAYSDTLKKAFDMKAKRLASENSIMRRALSKVPGLGAHFMLEDEAPKVKDYKVDAEGVAEICINGPLLEGDDWLCYWGYCTYGKIRRQVFEIQGDVTVKAIRLLIDSPGGTVQGAYETQRVLSGSAKPVIEARASTLCASAAYLLASTAQKITCDLHSSVGCIGTIMTVYGDKAYLSQLGVKRWTLVSNVSPYKNSDPDDTGDEGLQRLQAWIDKQGMVFVERVAQLRNVTVEKVLADYGKGDVIVGTDAVAAGLADELLGEAIVNQPGSGSEEAMGKTTVTGASAEDTKPKDEADATGGESTAAANEDMESGAEAEGGESTAEATTSAPVDAVEKERRRLKAIDDLRATGFEDIISNAKYGPKRLSVSQVKAQIYDEQKRRQLAAKGKVEQLATTKPGKGVTSTGPEKTDAQKAEEQNREAGKKVKSQVRP